MGHFPLFFAGILFYHLYFEKTSFKLVLGIAICYVTTLLIFQNVGRSHDFIELPQYIFMVSLCFGVFILLVNRKLGFIVNPVTLFLGKISYSLYLVHQFLGIKFLIPYLEKGIPCLLRPRNYYFHFCFVVDCLFYNEICREAISSIWKKKG